MRNLLPLGLVALLLAPATPARALPPRTERAIYAGNTAGAGPATTGAGSTNNMLHLGVGGAGFYVWDGETNVSFAITDHASSFVAVSWRISLFGSVVEGGVACNSASVAIPQLIELPPRYSTGSPMRFIIELMGPLDSPPSPCPSPSMGVAGTIEATFT